MSELVINPDRKYRYKTRAGRSAVIGYHVVFDPDPGNGYPVGAVFPKSEVDYMLTPLCRGFNPGTIIEDNYHNRFLIKSRKNGGLDKIPWQNESTEIKKK